MAGTFAFRAAFLREDTPDYGFRYNETRDGYVVDEEKMTVVISKRRRTRRKGLRWSL